MKYNLIVRKSVLIKTELIDYWVINKKKTTKKFPK